MADEVTASTVDTIISDLSTGSLNSTSFEGLLKDVYLPGLTNTVFNDSSFTGLIQKSSGQIDYKGQRIIRAFKTQRGGGVGAIGEGGDFVTSKEPKGQQGYENIKYLNAYFSITNPTLKIAKDDQGAFINALTEHFQDTIEEAKNDAERQITGGGQGVLGNVYVDGGGSSEPGGTYTLSITGRAYFDTQFFTPGQKLTIWDDANIGDSDNVKTYADASTLIGSTPVIVKSITQGDKDSSTKGTVTFTTTQADGTDDVVDGDAITKYSAWNAASGGGTCLEVNGLKQLVDDGTNYTNAWNLSRSSYSELAGYVKDFNSSELDEDNLLQVLMTMKYQYQAKPNLLVVSPRAMLKYFSNMKDDRRFNTLTAIEWVGGYQGMGIQLGDQRLMLTAVGSIDEDEIYMINTRDFAFATATNGYEWLTGQNDSILTQKEGSDAKFASAVNYLNFVCNDPGRQMKGTSVGI